MRLPFLVVMMIVIVLEIFVVAIFILHHDGCCLGLLTRLRWAFLLLRRMFL